MRKTDINKYAGSKNGVAVKTSTAKSFLKMLWKGVLTVLSVALVTGVIVLVSVISYVYSLKNESVNIDLSKLQLNYTSFIYVNGAGDDSSNPVKYKSLYSSENRIWVDYDKIPQKMKDAIISIEDKRFNEHKGVDWIRTFGAVKTLFTQGGSYGGSTITQQLIKNITGDNDVSLTRKLKEIFRAINLEKKYSKEEILTAYLNVVNFGSGCNGVQSAANLYFGKNIQDCDIAQCACIAGITQNPTAYNPLSYPAKNKERQQTVIEAMHGQGKITDAEYKAAMAESEKMVFVGKKKEDVVDENSVWNWYTDAMFEDVKEGLMEHYNCSNDTAVSMMYHGGLKIYSAMDSDMQDIAENVFTDNKIFPANDSKLQGGYVSMDYSGRILAIVGARGKKTSNRLYSLATDAQRQPGSTIKPLAVYAPAMDMGKINYSSIITDAPISNWKNGKSGPDNSQHKYYGKVTVEYALQWSLNAASAQLCKVISPNTSYNFLKQKLNFTSVQTADNTLAAMAVGGFTEGVTVKEMTAGFQIFGNGGKYYKPYTFYYVTDHDGNVILDNRGALPTQVISSTTATVIHKLLNNVVQNGTGATGYKVGITGWDVYGKTGTTNSNKDSWFIGGTPYAVAGIWTGYRQPATLRNTVYSKTVWKTIMSRYLKNKMKKTFELDSNVVSAIFCKQSGLLVNSGVCTSTGVGWYDKNNMPAICNLSHGGTSAANSSEGGTDSSSSPDSSKTESGETSSGDIGNISSQKSESKTQTEPSQKSNEEPRNTTSSNTGRQNP